jgi:hypothetical protein
MRFAPLALGSLLVLAACEGQARLPCAGADTQTDPSNCGGCGVACPAPPHAIAACTAGSCGVAGCEPGWLDLDPDSPGCEAASSAIPGAGFTLATPSSSTSRFQHAQTDGARVNQGVLGEPTPLPVGALEQTDGVYRNQPGSSPFLDEP